MRGGQMKKDLRRLRNYMRRRKDGVADAVEASGLCYARGMWKVDNITTVKIIDFEFSKQTQWKNLVLVENSTPAALTLGHVDKKWKLL